MRPPGARAAATVGLAAFVAVAVGLGAASAALADSGYTTVTLKTPQVTFQFPSAWTNVPVNKKALAAIEAKLAKANPGAAMTRQGQAQLLKVVTFFGGSFKAARAGGSFSVMTVQPKAVNALPKNLDEFSSATRSAYAKHGWLVVNTSEVKVGGKPAYRVDFLTQADAATGTAALRVGQLLVPDGSGGDEIVVTTSVDDAAAAVVDHILGSVRRPH